MITEIESQIYSAEAEYLSSQDLGVLKTQILYLEERLKIYEQLRTQEAEIFQYAANQISKNFADESELKVKQALKHWLLILRYCGMAMLFNDSLYLQQQILSWLSAQIEARQTQDLEKHLYSYLHKRLKKVLGNEQFSILQPYLEQSKNALLK